ncbi:MAG: hypothetical protein AB8B79_12450 [Granulosicoccus sp.]
MPNINLSDERRRDAVVKAESVRVDEAVRYLGPTGKQTWTRRILKCTTDHDLDSLSERFGSPELLVSALVEGDPEVDIERTGQFLWNTSKVWINPEQEMVFRVRQLEQIRDPAGKLKTTRERERQEPNVDSEIPLFWTGKKVTRDEAIRRYVFASKLQVVHINGLTFDFLFAMAKELADENKMLLLGAGKGGKSPLIFSRGSVPYRGFLEGRVNGNSYVLMLHLSNLELKLPDTRPVAKQ